VLAPIADCCFFRLAYYRYNKSINYQKEVMMLEQRIAPLADLNFVSATLVLTRNQLRNLWA